MSAKERLKAARNKVKDLDHPELGPLKIRPCNGDEMREAQAAKNEHGTPVLWSLIYLTTLDDAGERVFESGADAGTSPWWIVKPIQEAVLEMNGLDEGAAAKNSGTPPASA